MIEPSWQLQLVDNLKLLVSFPMRRFRFSVSE
jgi:hypothetical protein